MNGDQTKGCTAHLWNLLANVHRLAAGRELDIEEAMHYFCDPRRLASVVERSGILRDRVKRRKLELLITESRNGI